MLRRRIFSAAMASVMALSSVAVVAQAAETTNQVKTKADLEELITKTYGDSWRSDELSNYGSVSQQKMLDALEAADVILADTDADEEDYTVAYMMVEAVAKKLVIHSVEELKALIDDCQAIVDTNNIFNEELNDLRYTAGTFDALDEALGNAKDYVTSTSSSDITEAYETLEAAKGNLDKLNVVSKSMFQNAIKKYQDIVGDKYDYDTWRRGTMTSWVDLTTGNYWAFGSAGVSYASFGYYYDYILSCNAAIQDAYEQMEAIKGLTKTSDEDIYAGYKVALDCITLYNTWSVDDVKKSTKSGLSSLINKYHGQLVYDYATSGANGFDALLAAVKGVVVGTEKDESGVEQDVMLGVEYMSGTNDVWSTDTLFEGGYNNGGNDTSKNGVTKLLSATAVIKTDKTIYVPVNDNGYYDSKRDIQTTVAGKTAVGGKFQTISAKSKFDLATLIDVTSIDYSTAVNANAADGRGDIAAVNNDVLDYFDYSSAVANQWASNTGIELIYEGFGWDTSNPCGIDATTAFLDDKGRQRVVDYSVKLSDAMTIAQLYLSGNKDAIKDATDDIKALMDDTGVIAGDASATSKEYEMVYRYLYYALTDNYEGTKEDACSHTKADVAALIEDAWDLIEDTGDASIFGASNVALVAARKDAIEWLALAKADKKYKEYTASTTATAGSYIDSTSAYHDLETAYNQLKNEYNALKYSFGEIYDYMAEVADKIDDGELDATDALLAALEDTAYALSTVDPVTYTNDADYEDNYAFDGDREFNGNNRVVTYAEKVDDNKYQYIASIDAGVTIMDGNDDGEIENPTHAALKTAYEALMAAVAAQAEAEVVLGDANGDGKVNAADAAAIAKYAVGLGTVDEVAADYNKDGKVNVADAAAIIKAIVKAD